MLVLRAIYTLDTEVLPQCRERGVRGKNHSAFDTPREVDEASRGLCHLKLNFVERAPREECVYHAEITSDDYTCLIYLEAIRKDAVVTIDAEPVAIALLKMSEEELLERGGLLDYYLFQSNQAELIQLPFQVVNAAKRNLQGLRFSFADYRTLLLTKIIDQPTPQLTSYLGDVSRHVVYTWLFNSMIDKWALNRDVASRKRIVDVVVDDDQPRHLYYQEYYWLFFSALLRTRKDRMPDPDNFRSALDMMLIKVNRKEDSAQIEQFSALNSAFGDDYNRCWLQMSARVTSKLWRGLDRLIAKFEKVVEVGSAIPAAVESNRREYGNMSLYINEKMNALIQTLISEAPETMFDVKATKRWVEKGESLIHEQIGEKRLYNDVTSKATVVQQSGVVLRTYGYPKRLTSGTKRLQYRKYNTKTLSMKKKKSGNPMFYENDPIHKQTKSSAMLAHTATLGVPLWGNAKEDGTYGYSTFVENSDDDVSDDTEMMDTMLSSGKASEYINNKLHVSTIVIDIDIRPTSKFVLSEQFYRDCQELVESVPGIPANCTHIFFKSTTDSSDSKIGVHHHVRLPPGICCTTEYAKKVILIASEKRYLYPHTIGVFCGLRDGSVYDEAIYPSSHELAKGHMLRCPGNTKADGSRLLVPVYRSDDQALNDIDSSICCVHSYNGSDVGTLLLDINHVNPISDEKYLRNLPGRRLAEFVTSRCAKNIEKLMEEVNKRIVVFLPADPLQIKITKLLQILNDLWDSTGRLAMIKALDSVVGDHGITYTGNQISDCTRQSCLEYNRATETIVLKSRPNAKGFDLCPVRVHRNPHKVVDVEVFYKSSMIQFGLMVGGFKQSCKNKYLYNIPLHMRDVFLTARMKNLVANLLRSLQDDCGWEIITVMEDVDVDIDDNDDHLFSLIDLGEGEGEGEGEECAMAIKVKNRRQLRLRDIEPTDYRKPLAALLTEPYIEDVAIPLLIHDRLLCFKPLSHPSRILLLEFDRKLVFYTDEYSDFLEGLHLKGLDYVAELIKGLDSVVKK
jgi:hypothetical protein